MSVRGVSWLSSVIRIVFGDQRPGDIGMTWEFFDCCSSSFGYFVKCAERKWNETKMLEFALVPYLRLVFVVAADGSAGVTCAKSVLLSNINDRCFTGQLPDIRLVQ